MTKAEVDFHGGRDPGELPLYSANQAAGYLGLAPSTLRSWVHGWAYPTQKGSCFFAPLIAPPEDGGLRLSFLNLIEAHVLWSLRSKRRVPLHGVRQALCYAEQALGVKRLLVRPELRTTGKELFLDRYSELIKLTKAGQLVMRRLLEGSLQRIERDESDLPIRLFPFAREGQTRDRLIVIDPRVHFGRPIVATPGVSVAALVDRIDAGEELSEVARDYELDASEIEEALVYVRTA